MDRNVAYLATSARLPAVALRKESVDRNVWQPGTRSFIMMSLSARRAWIEMELRLMIPPSTVSRSPQGERG